MSNCRLNIHWPQSQGRPGLVVVKDIAHEGNVPFFMFIFVQRSLCGHVSNVVSENFGRTIAETHTQYLDSASWRRFPCSSFTVALSMRAVFPDTIHLSAFGLGHPACWSGSEAWWVEALSSEATDMTSILPEQGICEYICLVAFFADYF